MLARETELPVAGGEDHDDAGGDRCCDGGGECLIGC